VNDVNNIMSAERAQAKEEAYEAVKAALLISGADKQRYGILKNDLANDYLLGTDQYANTFDKVLRILGTYQTSKSNLPSKGSPNNLGVAFLQQRGCAGRGQGRGRCGRGTGAGNAATALGAYAGGGTSDAVSVVTGAS
jgi:hypothetical protein